MPDPVFFGKLFTNHITKYFSVTVMTADDRNATGTGFNDWKPPSFRLTREYNRICHPVDGFDGEWLKLIDGKGCVSLTPDGKGDEDPLRQRFRQCAHGLPERAQDLFQISLMLPGSWSGDVKNQLAPGIVFKFLP